MTKYNRKDIKGSLLDNNIVEADPYIYPMSAVRDEELFRSILFNNLILKGEFPNVIVEIGTYVGISALLLIQYCNCLHTFDITDHPPRQKVWDFAGVEDNDLMCGGNIFFHHIKDDNEKAKILTSIKPDFCFIDGRHHGGIDVDFNMLKGRCNKFLFHDYCPKKSILNGKSLYDYVYTFIESIKPNAKVIDARPPFIYMEF